MDLKYKRIRELREDHDLTQAQVGEKINVPQRTYAYYESASAWSRRKFYAGWAIYIM